MKSYAPLGGSVGHARSRPAPPARTTRAEAGQAEQMGLEPSTFMICVAKTPSKSVMRPSMTGDAAAASMPRTSSTSFLSPSGSEASAHGPARPSRTARASDHVRRDGSRHPRRLEDKAPHAFDVETGGGDRGHRFPIGMAASSE